MIFPEYARYDKLMHQVNSFFVKENVTDFPIDPFQTIANNKWGLITYSEIAEERGVWIEDIINAVQSEDGYTIYDGYNYTIAFNDTIRSHGRIRFTLMHEIGHIYMNHLVDFQETILTRSTLTEEKYKVLEDEANGFARNVLAPVMIVKQLKYKDPMNLVEYFGLSQSAAKVRFDAIHMDYRRLNSQFINFQRKYFQSYVYLILNSKYCVVCSHHFIGERAEFCPICGYKSLTNHKGVDNMIYNGHFLDDNSRATICPKCDNELLHYEGDYCTVCGTYLVNKCAPTHRTSETGYGYLEDGCDTLLDGDARFCMRCGNESTFYQQGLLQSWEEEKSEKAEKEKEEKKQLTLF